MNDKFKYWLFFILALLFVPAAANVFSMTDVQTLKMVDKVNVDFQEGSTEVITETTVETSTEISTEERFTETHSEEREIVSENEGVKENIETDSYRIENFEIIWQMPELPTGCEITAMTMVLNYYGFNVDKVTMATKYLPVASPYFYYGSDGKLYGPDLNSYFVGNPAAEGGYICGATAIINGANSYLRGQNSSLTAVDKTGISIDELYSLVKENIPVMVWVTIAMADRGETKGWYTEKGNYVDWSTNDHGAVLIGYSNDSVTIADPISGIINYNRSQFEKVFASRGNMCVILQN